jgi:hypothetical protein
MCCRTACNTTSVQFELHLLLLTWPLDFFFLTNSSLSTSNSASILSTMTTKKIMSNLLTLPAELLCEVADHVDGEDLINMRLACKPLHDAANRPFGLTYITHRCHALTPASIEALLEIVTHPALGSYVNSISMVAAFPVTLDPKYGRTIEYAAKYLPEAYVNSRSYMQLMKQVFAKILEHQTPVHITICDPESESGYGWDEMLEDPSLYWSRCYEETLDNTLVAAIRANCHVQTLELNMHGHNFDRLHDVLEDLFSPTRPPLKLIIHCPRKRIRALYCPYTITYDQADQSLKLDGIDVYELARAKEGSSIKRLFGFLLAQTTHLTLEDGHLCSEHRFASFLALDQTKALYQNLTSVRMQNFRPCRSIGDLARRHWSGIIRSLSEFTGLKYFVMEDLHHSSCWKLFHLPRKTEKYELSGEDVAEELEALAALVATEWARAPPQLDVIAIEGGVNGLGMD